MSPDPTTLRVLAHFPEAFLEPLRGRVPGVSFAPVPREGPVPQGLAGEVLLTQAWGASNLPEVVKRGVRWIHAFGTGVDRFPFAAVEDRILTCARGAGAVPIAEWVLAVMLAFEKRLPQAWIHEPPENWNFFDLGGLHGRALGLVGLGGIATAVARRALAFGMRVRAYRRTARESPLPEIEVVSDLGELLRSADHLVVAAPATAATRHLIGAEALGRVRRGVHLVNVARGTLVDQEALRGALDDGRVALASLDTVEPEPLPKDHWLYSHPRVRLSPHISWSMPGSIEAILETFVENLQRYRAGLPLTGRVDVEQGY